METPPCIMVIDDEEAIRTLLQRILESKGYKVVTACDAESALAQMKETAPSLLLMDIMMPDMDGLQLLDRIRIDSNVPVIMLTGLGELGTLNHAFDIGADDYITKPFNTPELLARIRAKLRRSGCSCGEAIYNLAG